VSGPRVAALFVRRDSVYRELGADCYDIERDARTFDLACPVVAHPPCRAWGQLARFAKPRADERDLAHWAVHVVRHCGGVLEHPINSKLWHEISAGTDGVRDRFGGVAVTLRQSWYGHPCAKPTRLYIVGPVLELASDGPAPTHEIAGRGARRGRLPGASRPMREHTPRDLAAWMVASARAAA
jgi:hypothetical protein